uniref:Uncharacterized protein n=1 Tax=Anguilla anguilla TaxID=7936 RepID=A0A0E9XHX7_ANGAN
MPKQKVCFLPSKLVVKCVYNDLGTLRPFPSAFM